MTTAQPPLPLTDTQAERVHASFELLMPVAPMAARLFYARLFELHPMLRALFRGDLERQGRLLVEMIGTAVGLLGRRQALEPMLRQLGARHAGWGVLPWHYGAVSEALVHMLHHALGPSFGSAEREAWTRLLAYVAHVMQQAGASAAPAAAEPPPPFAAGWPAALPGPT